MVAMEDKKGKRKILRVLFMINLIICLFVKTFDTQDPCLSNPCPTDVSACIPSQQQDMYACACNIGSGTYPEDCLPITTVLPTTAVPPGPCENHACQNGGVCLADSMVIGLGYTCLCTNQYTGVFCQTLITTTTTAAGPCQSNPCQNGGTCFTGDTGLAFACVCPTGYNGVLCENMITTTVTTTTEEVPVTLPPFSDWYCLNEGNFSFDTQGYPQCSCGDFLGLRCDTGQTKELVTTTINMEATTGIASDKSAFSVIAGSAAAGALLIIATGLIICFVMRKKRYEKKQKEVPCVHVYASVIPVYEPTYREIITLGLSQPAENPTEPGRRHEEANINVEYEIPIQMSSEPANTTNNL